MKPELIQLITILNGEDITVDNENKSIISNKSSILIDNDGNEIFLEILNTYMGKIYLNLMSKLRLMIKMKMFTNSLKYI